jgi:hypothetical protein
VTGWEVGEATFTERRILLEREQALFGTDSALGAEWLFDRNPAGRALVLVARTPEGAIAGTRSLLPWRVLVDDREVPIGQYARTWTEPEHRNRGVSIAIGREINRRSQELGYPLVYLFPSVRSIPGHRTVGNRLVTALERRQALGSARFFHPGAPGFLDAPVGWLRRARNRARSGAHWGTESNPSAMAAGLWEGMPRGRGVVGIRDAAFVAWRYSPESGREYVAWRYPASGEARLLAFVHRAGTRARILEVLGRADPEETASALAHLVEQLVTAGAWLVEWCPPRHGEGPGLAARAGFFPRRHGLPLGLWFNRPEEELGPLGDPRTYRFTEGDSDYA